MQHGRVKIWELHFCGGSFCSLGSVNKLLPPQNKFCYITEIRSWISSIAWKNTDFWKRKEYIQSWIHLDTSRPALHTWVLWIYMYLQAGWEDTRQYYRSRSSVPRVRMHYIHLISCSVTKGIPFYIWEHLERYICKGRILKRKVWSNG